MKSILLGFLLFSLLSCSSSSGPDNIHLSDWRYPVIEGLVYTDDVGNVLGEWKNPYYQGSRSELENSEDLDKISYSWNEAHNVLSVSNTQESMTPSTFITFVIPQKTHVLLYIVPAVLNPKDSVPSGNSVNGLINIPGGLATETLIDREMSAGKHLIQWNSSQNKSGFYRFYIETKDYKIHRNMSLFTSICEMPFEIRHLFYDSFFYDSLPCK